MYLVHVIIKTIILAVDRRSTASRHYNY